MRGGQVVLAAGAMFALFSSVVLLWGATAGNATCREHHAQVSPDASQTAEEPSWSDVMCRIPDLPVWQAVQSKRFFISSHHELNSRILREVILPEVRAKRAPFQSTMPPPLPMASEHFCDKSGFRGMRKNTTAKQLVVDVIFFGVDIDMLEVRLLELQDVVDVFVIFESDRTHSNLDKGLLLAPLIERLKKQFSGTRIIYAPFTDLQMRKITADSGAFVVDRNDMRDWSLETRSRQLMFYEVLAAFPEAEAGFVISGDADEIPSRHTVWAARNCEWIEREEKGEMCSEAVQYQYSFGTLFKAGHSPTGKQDEIRRFPIFLRWPTLRARAAKKLNENDIRPYYVPRSCDTAKRGVHLSWFNGLYRHIFKILATVEGSQHLRGPRLFHAMLCAVCHSDAYHREVNTTGNMFHPHWKKLISNDTKLVRPLPWAISANPERYASFYGIFPSCGPSSQSFCQVLPTLELFLNSSK